jgi:hypothetical protein
MPSHLQRRLVRAGACRLAMAERAGDRLARNTGHMT